MLGAIVGDIVGSVYEWNNIKTKDFPLFRDDCFFTDDSIMTIATADALMNGGEPNDFINAYKTWGKRYPGASYGDRMRQWINSDEREPYMSWGNGSAMRVSPCAWLMDCGFTARTGMWPQNGLRLAETSAAVTHNHPEGIKGALAVADTIFMCRFYSGGFGYDRGDPLNEQLTFDEYKGKIKNHIQTEYEYDLSKSLDDIRPSYKFNESCQDTVPQAIIAFLESSNFEDAIRNAISLGGDSDTLAAITGSIAEAAYGIPEEIKNQAMGYLDETLLDTYKKWSTFQNKQPIQRYR